MKAEDNSNLQYQTFKQEAGRKTDTYLRWSLLKRADQNSQFDKLLSKNKCDAAAVAQTDESNVNKKSEDKLQKEETPQDPLSDRKIFSTQENNKKNTPAGHSIFDVVREKEALNVEKRKAISLLDQRFCEQKNTSFPQNDNKNSSPRKHIDFSLQAKELAAKQRSLELKKLAAKKVNSTTSISGLLQQSEGNAGSRASRDIHATLQRKLSPVTQKTLSAQETLETNKPVNAVKTSSISEALKLNQGNNTIKTTISSSEAEHIDFSLRAKAIEAAQRSKELKINALASSGSSITQALNRNDANKGRDITLLHKAETNNTFNIGSLTKQEQFATLFTCRNKNSSIPNEDSLKDIFHRIESCQ